MAWHLDILLGFVISLSFLFGGVLYIWSGNELDNLFEKLKKTEHVKILLVSAVLLGIIFAIILKTNWKDLTSLILFILILTMSSISFVGEDKKTTIKYSSASMLLFFVSFLLVYLLRI